MERKTLAPVRERKEMGSVGVSRESGRKGIGRRCLGRPEARTGSCTAGVRSSGQEEWE